MLQPACRPAALDPIPTTPRDPFDGDEASRSQSVFNPMKGDRSDCRPASPECKDERRQQPHNTEWGAGSGSGGDDEREARPRRTASREGAPSNHDRPRSEPGIAAGPAPATENDVGSKGLPHVIRSRFFASLGAPAALVRADFVDLLNNRRTGGGRGGGEDASPTELINIRTSRRRSLDGTAAGTSTSTSGWGESDTTGSGWGEPDNMTTYSFSTGGRGRSGHVTTYSFTMSEGAEGGGGEGSNADTLSLSTGSAGELRGRRGGRGLARLPCSALIQEPQPLPASRRLSCMFSSLSAYRPKATGSCTQSLN